MQELRLVHHFEKMIKLKLLGKEHDIVKYIDLQTIEQKDILTTWANFLLDQSECQSNVCHLPKSVQYKLKAWQAFYEQDYAQAQKTFALAMQEPDWQQDALSSSLGMAKVYTRTGHWQLAQKWCLFYLRLARQSLGHFEIAKGYGALAEIFLRAGRSKESLACFQLAYHLMPLQSGQKARQYNYMASALLRHGEFLRAEALLYSGYKEAERALQSDSQDGLIGVLHSQMRMAFLYLLQGKTNVVILQDRLVKNSQISIKEIQLPTAMTHAAMGIKLLQQNDFSQAGICFKTAMSVLTSRFLLEYLWISRLYQFCQSKLGLDEQDDLAVIQQIEQLLMIQQIYPPEDCLVVDKTWQSVELPEQGFDQLLNSNLGQDKLIDLWKLFFI